MAAAQKKPGIWNFGPFYGGPGTPYSQQTAGAYDLANAPGDILQGLLSNTTGEGATGTNPWDYAGAAPVNGQVPQTRGQSILHMLNPQSWVSGAANAIAGSGQDISDWWNYTGEQPQGGGADVNGMLSDALQGLMGGGQGSAPAFSVPGALPGGGKLPLPPKIGTPDFGPAEAALAQGKPQDTAELIAPHQLPGALTPEEQADLVSKGKRGGVAKALLNTPEGANFWTVLANAGFGGLAGKTEEERQLRTETRAQARDQSMLDLNIEEKNLAQKDKLTEDKFRFALSSAGVEEHKATEVARVATENTKLQYNYALESAKQSIEATKEMQPKILSLGDGRLAFMTRNPQTGAQEVRMGALPKVGGLEGLAPGTDKDLHTLQAGAGSPFTAGHALVLNLDPGQRQQVFGADIMKKVFDKVNNQIPADLRTRGTVGEKKWQEMFDDGVNVELTNYILQPEFLKNAMKVLPRKVTNAQ